MGADAIIIGTPVFQASIPGTLKNIFDLLPVNAFRDKVVSMLVTAGTPKHYLMVEQQLKPILAYMKAQIVQTYVFIEEKDFYRKEITNDDVLFRMERLVEDTVVLTETYRSIREAKEANRITSYNVCYTKLLRKVGRSFLGIIILTLEVPMLGISQNR